MKNLEFYIAYKFLHSKSKDSFISITQKFSFLGIVLGVATLIIVTSVMNGFRFELIKNITDMNGHATIKSNKGYINNYKKLINDLKNNKYVRQVSCCINEQSLILANQKYKGLLVLGIDFEELKNREKIEIVLGKNHDKESIGIGVTLLKSINARLGDKIKVISPILKDTGFGQIPKAKTFTIGFIFSSGLYNYDSNVLIMPLEKARKLFLYKENTVSDIQVFLKDQNLIDKFINSLDNNSLYKDLYILNWQNSNKSLMNAVKIERNVMTLILTLIILVAAFNIISGMVMLVKDKRKDIAILRTLGFSRYSIVKIFLICGSFIGISGTFFGSVLGILFSINIDSIKKILEYFSGINLFSAEIYFLLEVPCKIQSLEILVITISSLIISFLAALYPAIKAGKQNPVEILRYE